MPDYAGAVAAIKARLITKWVDGSNNPLTLIVYVNKQPDPPFPPIDPVTGNPAPFLVCEIAGTNSNPYTFGNLGNQFFVYNGLILLHVLVPMDEGAARAQQLAVIAGEIFRSATFYVDANGSYLRTMAPHPPDGGSAANIEGIQAGNTFRVTISCPFQFFYRAFAPLGGSGPPAPPLDLLPAPPLGFVYLQGADGAYLTGADGAYLLGTA
jgi:hypothetical protein